MRLEDHINERLVVLKNISRLKARVEAVRGEERPMSSVEVSCWLEILETYFKEGLIIQRTIEKLDPNDEGRLEFEGIYVATKTLMHSRMSQSPHNSTLLESTCQPHASKLPKLKLPSFSGNYADFKNFFESFTQLVDSESSLTNIEKFNHLLNSLQGQALDTVRAFQVTHENYPKAIARLKSRFDNQTLIFLENISALFQMPSISSPNSVKLRSLVDKASALYDSLLSLGSEKQISQAMLIYLVIDKADPQTKKKWSESLDFKQLPSWENCTTVLERHCQYLETIYAADHNAQPKDKGLKIQKQQHNGSSFFMSKSTCQLCSNQNHKINACPRFRSMEVVKRFEAVKRLELCLNCLSSGHMVENCRSKYRCKECSKSHHSLLHRVQQQKPEKPSTEEVVVHSHISKVSPSQVILATATILVQDASGGYKMGRALLDSCSQVNLMTESFAQFLRLPRKKQNIQIHSVGDSQTNIKYQTSTNIRSRISEFSMSLSFCITPNIAYQPDAEIEVSSWNVPKNIELADENFFKSRPIDLLLGTEFFFDNLMVGQFKPAPNLPIFQKTALGWVVSGRCGSSAKLTSSTCLLTMEENIDQTLEKFWQIEEIPDGPCMTAEQQLCEDLFQKTVSRTQEGRVIVNLPFLNDPRCLGLSYGTAYRRFLAQERRYSKSSDLMQQYISFMKEYQDLGHMTLVPSPNLEEPHFYIPHHCVMRPSSTSTKLRVVFDASCKSSSQISLNDTLLVGPVLQPELYTLLLQFRTYQFALTADIVKMYRQVLVAPEDRKYQYILWRNSSADPLQTYQLNTVTYGTASAPYLAVKSLNYLADLYCNEYPVGSRVIKTSFYVDDLLCGADSLDELSCIKNQVSEILRRGCMQLDKWHSNCSKFMDDSTIKNLNLDETSVTSTLGVKWDQKCDQFLLSFNAENALNSRVTKRTILSTSSSLFDPLGLVAPIIIKAKIILQELWLLKLDWDESIPQNLHTAWCNFVSNLVNIHLFKIPRFCLSTNLVSLQIHAFCDASLRAYGCCYYARCMDSHGNVSVHLITAKSRVAPTKKISLPKLELCGALLMAKLHPKIATIFDRYKYESYCWTDSQIVLHWLKMHSATLSVFVGNRVSKIQDLTKTSIWRHVPTKSNPADLVSRGSTIEELHASCWFKGPEFLTSDTSDWPENSCKNLDLEEVEKEKRKSIFAVAVGDNYLLDQLEKFSSYLKCIKIVAAMLRFARLANKNAADKSNEPFFSPQELQTALWCVIWNLQQKFFASEINCIQKNQQISSSLKFLTPFLQIEEKYNLLKVGGRLEFSDLPPNSKHQVLIPNQAHFCMLLVRHLHQVNYHAGPKTLIAIIQQNYWIINARDIARRVVRSCVHCVRYRPKLLEQIMGNLPMDRVVPAKPFSKCGVDFCGPFNTYLRIRGKAPYKTYVAIFICFVTKAVHIEIVSDLSTEAFLAALRRMIGRRGLPTTIYCDNATNFVGASNHLAELKAFLFDPKNQNQIYNFCSKNFTNFCFIPPRAPHFGGLWEAAVKVAKGHLHRSLMNTRLTFEELYTALVEVEAIMNSRPISALSTDPNDLQPLTPGHFLVGTSLRAFPTAHLDDSQLSPNDRWAHVTAIRQRFWDSWRKDYLNELQVRSKWPKEVPNVAPGTIVIIHEDNMPPQKWLLGRVVSVVPGKDAKIRVVDIQTTKGLIRRPIRKIAVLPA